MAKEYFKHLNFKPDDDLDSLIIYGRNIKTEVRLILGIYKRDSGLSLSVPSFMITPQQRNRISKQIGQFDPKEKRGQS